MKPGDWPQHKPDVAWITFRDGHTEELFRYLADHPEGNQYELFREVWNHVDPVAMEPMPFLIWDDPIKSHRARRWWQRLARRS